jgi:hypothetical protein
LYYQLSFCCTNVGRMMKFLMSLRYSWPYDDDDPTILHLRLFPSRSPKTFHDQYHGTMKTVLIYYFHNFSSYRGRNLFYHYRPALTKCWWRLLKRHWINAAGSSCGQLLMKTIESSLDQRWVIMWPTVCHLILSNSKLFIPNISTEICIEYDDHK